MQFFPLTLLTPSASVPFRSVFAKCSSKPMGPVVAAVPLTVEDGGSSRGGGDAVLRVNVTSHVKREQ